MTQSPTERAAPTEENLEQVWKDHLAGEFINKDVEATLATMTEDAFVNHRASQHRGSRQRRVTDILSR
jgi:hypothetical protein